MSSKIVAAKSVIVVIILLLVGVLAVLGISTVRTYLSGATAGFDPSNVMTKPDSTTTVVTWTSDKESKGFVEYGTTPASLLLRTQEESAVTMSHQVKIESLKSNTTYYFRIRAGEVATDKNEWEIFDNNGIPYTFKTTSGEADSQMSTQVLPTVAILPTVAATTITGQSGACQSGVDYNADGVVNSIDYRYCLSHGSGAATTPGVTSAASAASSSGKTCQAGTDYNGDGIINSLDILKCRQSQ